VVLSRLQRIAADKRKRSVSRAHGTELLIAAVGGDARWRMRAFMSSASAPPILRLVQRVVGAAASPTRAMRRERVGQ
jgi:hypothetical protein